MNCLNPRTSVSNKPILSIFFFLVLAAEGCFGAAWEGADDFLSGISPANWTSYQTYVGDMIVAAANGHASFLVSVSADTEQNAFIIWRGTPTAAEDWAAEIHGHNSAFHPSCALQFAVLDTAAWNSGAVYGLQVGMRNNLAAGAFGTSWWHFPGGSTQRSSVGTTSTDFRLRLVYRAAGQTVEAWYDPTASGQGWKQLDSMTLNQISPSMTATSTFTFAILANTDYGPISEGEIWADDFGIRLAPPLLLVAGAQRVGDTQHLQLTWTNNGAACVLEGAGAVTGGGWSTVSTPWATNAGWVSTTVTNSSSAQFYRLRTN